MLSKQYVGTVYVGNEIEVGVFDYFCLSTDSKPTDAVVNSFLLELDTKTLYYFDGEQWQTVGGSNA